MSRRRLFLPPQSIAGDRARLTPEAAHYLRDVLRLLPGAELELFDGAGGTYPAEVEEGLSTLRLGPRREARPKLELWLLAALSKGEKMDLTVQKATELGATRIAPFPADRSVVRIDPGKAAERALRWRRIAEEAARQCGRSEVPSVASPSPLAELLAAIPEGFARFAFHPGGEPLADATGGAAVAGVVGPEGGLSPEEVLACERAGARSVSLGPRILRAETAAIVAVALLQARFGDLR